MLKIEKPLVFLPVFPTFPKWISTRQYTDQKKDFSTLKFYELGSKNHHQPLSFKKKVLLSHTQELTHIPKVRIQFAEFLYLHFPILLEPWRLRSPDAVRYGFFFWKHLS